jgi:Coenzyme PQQ synthesis protein D (PqqD)
MIRLDTVRLIKRFDLMIRDVDGEVVIVDLRAGRVHQLNRTASIIWEACDGESTVAELADVLAHRFNVDPVTASNDVLAAVTEFQKFGLFDPDA